MNYAEIDLSKLTTSKHSRGCQNILQTPHSAADKIPSNSLGKQAQNSLVLLSASSNNRKDSFNKSATSF